MSDRRLVESVSHDELLATDGAEAGLWQAWQDSDRIRLIFPPGTLCR